MYQYPVVYYSGFQFFGKRYISFSTRSMATNIDRVITPDKKVLSTESYDLLILRSRDK